MKPAVKRWLYIVSAAGIFALSRWQHLERFALPVFLVLALVLDMQQEIMNLQWSNRQLRGHKRPIASAKESAGK
jgi:hypothetical protein